MTKLRRKRLQKKYASLYARYTDPAIKSGARKSAIKARMDRIKMALQEAKYSGEVGDWFEETYSNGANLTLLTTAVIAGVAWLKQSY